MNMLIAFLIFLGIVAYITYKDYKKEMELYFIKSIDISNKNKLNVKTLKLYKGDYISFFKWLKIPKNVKDESEDEDEEHHHFKRYAINQLEGRELDILIEEKCNKIIICLESETIELIL